MPHQLRPRGSCLVKSSSHKWRRKILKLTRQDYEYEQGILTPSKRERSDYAIDNTVLSSRFHGNRKAEQIGRKVDTDNYDWPIQTISRSADGRFVLGDPEVVRENRTDYMTLDSSVYPTIHARASHIQGSQGKKQDGRRQCHMQSSWDYVQFYHPQYYLMQDKDKELGLPTQRMRYPDVHLAALEAPCHDHSVPTNDDNGFYPIGDWASSSAGPQYSRRRYRERNFKSSGGYYSQVQRRPSRRTYSYHNQPPSGQIENYRPHGIYSQIEEQGSNEQYNRTHQLRSRSADSYYGNYANYPPPPPAASSNEYSSRSRPIRREEDYVRISSCSAPPATPSYRSRVYPRDTPQDHNYDHIAHYHPPDGITSFYHSSTRAANSHSHSPTPYSRVLSTPISRPASGTTSGTPQSRRTSGSRPTTGTPYSGRATVTPGADYRSYLTSSPDIDDGSGQPFVISDVSSVLPGSSLMTSSNQMPSSLVTSPSLQMTSSSGTGHHDSGNQPRMYQQHPVSPLYPPSQNVSGSKEQHTTSPSSRGHRHRSPSRSLGFREQHPTYPACSPDDRNSSLLHQRSLSDGYGIHWRDPQQYLYSGSAPLVEERVNEGIYSPRTVEFMDRYIADVDNRARGKKHRQKPRMFPPLQTDLALPPLLVGNGSSPEELAYTRDKLTKAIKHVRKGRLQSSHGYSAPELGQMHQRQVTRETRVSHWDSNIKQSSPKELERNKHERNSSFAQSVAPFKGYSSSKPTSVASSSGRESGSHVTGKGTRLPSLGALQPDVQPGDDDAQGGTSKDSSSHSTSGLGSKDTSRSVSSQGGVVGTGSHDHVITQARDQRSSLAPPIPQPITTHGAGPIRDSSLRTREISGDRTYEFDSALEDQLIDVFRRYGSRPEGAGVTHSRSAEDIDPNESMDDKFERLRREYEEYQSSQENLDTEAPPQFSSGSSWNEFESEML